MYVTIFLEPSLPLSHYCLCDPLLYYFYMKFVGLVWFGGSGGGFVFFFFFVKKTCQF